MVALVPGRTLRRKESSIVVENDLAPGRYQFRLTVVDDGENESAPYDLTVTISRKLPVTRPDVILRSDPLRRPVDPQRIDPRVVTPLRRPT